jgi:hypothetical protein
MAISTTISILKTERNLVLVFHRLSNLMQDAKSIREPAKPLQYSFKPLIL